LNLVNPLDLYSHTPSLIKLTHILTFKYVYNSKVITKKIFTLRSHIGVKFSHTGSLVPWKVEQKRKSY